MTAHEVAKDGSVGMCTRGPAAGQQIFLVRDTRPDWWQLYLQPPWDRFVFGDSRFAFDNYIEGDEAIEAMMLQWGVTWIAREDDDAVERAVFDVRSTLNAD